MRWAVGAGALKAVRSRAPARPHILEVATGGLGEINRVAPRAGSMISATASWRVSEKRKGMCVVDDLATSAQGGRRKIRTRRQLSGSHLVFPSTACAASSGPSKSRGERVKLADFAASAAEPALAKGHIGTWGDSWAAPGWGRLGGRWANEHIAARAATIRWRSGAKAKSNARAAPERRPGGARRASGHRGARPTRGAEATLERRLCRSGAPARRRLSGVGDVAQPEPGDRRPSGARAGTPEQRPSGARAVPERRPSPAIHG